MCSPSQKINLVKDKVFISGSISIRRLPDTVKESLDRIIQNNLQILIGDADGIDSLIQRYCQQANYNRVTVYSIYSSPRFMVHGFSHKQITPNPDIKKERERQQAKDIAMTEDSGYSLVIWDGKSKGSYNNILRSLEKGQKIKVYSNESHNFFIPSSDTEVESIFRKNNGYAAGEVVDLLKSKGNDFFKNTRAFNKALLEHRIITKEGKVYHPAPKYEHLMVVLQHKGRATGIRFTHDFIGWLEKWIPTIAPQESKALF